MSDPIDDRLAELLQRYVDDALDDAECAELSERLRSSAAARRSLVRLCLHAQMLAEVLTRESNSTPTPSTKTVRPVSGPDATTSEPAVSRPSAAERRAWPSQRGWAYVAILASTCVFVAVAVWLTQLGAPVGPNVELVADWRITPTGRAVFRVLEPTVVELTRGELLVESTREGEVPNTAKTRLRIETPQGEATAIGTRFYIGTHRPLQVEEPNSSKPLTRVFVLSGMVTLTSAMGVVEGAKGDLLAAEPGEPPTKLVVRSNGDFALDLYRQLASDHAGRNLAFSPYSISNALVMAAHGARGATAIEMGEVLRLPRATRRVGADAQRIPWETSLVHSGLAELNQRLNGGGDTPEETARVRAKLEELRPQLAAAKEAHRSARDAFRKTRSEQNKRRFVEAHETLSGLEDEITTLSARIDLFDLAVANALWVEQSYRLRESFVTTVDGEAQIGSVFSTNLRGDPEGQRARINDWVSELTKGRVAEALPAGSLDAMTRLVLTNAIYFKGRWVVPFDPERTDDRTFTRADGSRVERPMMYAPNLMECRYGESEGDGDDEGFQILELPYKGDRLSMVFLLPEAGDPSDLEHRLTAERFVEWMGQLQRRQVDVLLPKFSLGTEYLLGDEGTPGPLQRMGMRTAFVNPGRPDGADFTGISESADPDDGLYLRSVFHRAVVEVNEEGTEAAAVTSLPAPSAGVNGGGPTTPVFRADRPFLFVVRDKVSGTILFLGRIMDPE